MSKKMRKILIKTTYMMHVTNPLKYILTSISFNKKTKTKILSFEEKNFCEPSRFPLQIGRHFLSCNPKILQIVTKIVMAKKA